MKNSASANFNLYDWANEHTRHLDLVASWETLLSVYRGLEFIDPVNDDIRLTEFKWIITETNKFLSRMRRDINKETSIEGILRYLRNHFNVPESNKITGRKELAYYKLRYRWLKVAETSLENQMKQSNEQDERTEDE